MLMFLAYFYTFSSRKILTWLVTKDTNIGEKPVWKIWGSVHAQLCRNVIEVHVFLDRRDKKEASARSAVTENQCHWAAYACSHVGTQMRTTLSPGDAEAAVVLEYLGEWWWYSVFRARCPGSFWVSAPLIFLLHHPWHVPICSRVLGRKDGETSEGLLSLRLP